MPKADKKAKRKEYKEKIKSLKKNPTIPVKSFEHIANEEIERRVVDVASFLGLSDLLKRNPSTLSGGQKQRVALAKAMVREPKVLLLDEPLSSLDQKLRKEARELIKKVHLKAGCTTVMVSHDQEDASLADVVMIMKEGKIEQIGSVQEIYEKPNSLYCASFFGKPSINVLPDECLDLLGIKGDVITAIRAEDIKIEETKESGVTYIEMDVTTTKEELLGHDKIIYFSINGSDCCLKASRNIKKEPNEPMRIYIDSRKVHIFSKTTGVRL